MEQFDEIENLFKQLQDPGNHPIPESHLNDLNKRLDAFVPQTSSHIGKTAFRKTITITAITVIAASVICFVYNKLSEHKSSLENTVKTETREDSSTSPANVSQNEDKEVVHVIENEETITGSSVEKDKQENNTVVYTNVKVESKHSNTKAIPNATVSNTTKTTLFKLISDPNTVNQTLSENEEIAEIKYSVSYYMVSPTIYINLPKGLKYSYSNNILVVKGTPANLSGKQSVSIKALANDVIDSVNFIITVQKP